MLSLASIALLGLYSQSQKKDAEKCRQDEEKYKQAFVSAWATNIALETRVSAQETAVSNIADLEATREAVIGDLSSLFSEELGETVRIIIPTSTPQAPTPAPGS